LNFGKNYEGARDDFVYVYSHDSDTAYRPAQRMVLARVPKDRIRDRASYEFFRSLDAEGRPLWSRDPNDRGGIFAPPGGCYRMSVSYFPAQKRYLMCQAGTDAPVRTPFGVYDAPEPWGPWTTVDRAETWDVNPGESCSFPTKWMSPDG